MSVPLRVLHLEDSPGDAGLVRRALAKADFAVQVERVEDAAQFRAALARQPWDVVIADYRLPQFDAPGALGVLHETGLDLPFIVVSGVIGEESAVQLMKAGANDYVLKDNLARLGPSVTREVAEARRREQARHAREELQRSQALLATLVESTTDAVYVKDLAGRYLWFNPAAAALTGKAAAEVIGRDDTALWPAAEAQVIMADDRRIMAGDRPQLIEEEVTTPAGRRTLFTTKGPLRGADGSPIGVFGIARDITPRRLAEDELRASHAQLRALAARLCTIREEQGAHIAREIHDVLGQQLTALKFDLVWLRRRCADVGDAQLAGDLAEKIATALQLADASIQTVQKIATELRPGTLDKLGLVAALQQVAREFGERTRIRCELAPMPETLALDSERSTGVFRICQETLTNVARHARATRVQIRLACDPAGLTLEVRDNGVGIASEHLTGRSSLGLLGMHERAMLLGGRLEISGAAGQGTTVKLQLPIPPGS